MKDKLTSLIHQIQETEKREQFATEQDCAQYQQWRHRVAHLRTQSWAAATRLLEDCLACPENPPTAPQILDSLMQWAREATDAARGTAQDSPEDHDRRARWQLVFQFAAIFGIEDPFNLHPDPILPISPTCAGLKRNGHPCNATPRTGHLYCHLHQSQAPPAQLTPEQLETAFFDEADRHLGTQPKETRTT